MREAINMFVVCAAVLIGSAAAEEPVYFEDANLKQLIEDKLWVTDPTPSDMLGLTYLYAGSEGIQSLTGLEYATNLQTLFVRWNQIGSLAPLTSLTNLVYLDAHGNHDISDLSPLPGLAQLETLVIRINSISDISPLAGLSRLKTLDLRWNEISDISALASLANLETCYLQWNEIVDISPLTQLAALQDLDLRANPLAPEACEIYIPQIIANNPDAAINYDACVVHELTISSTVGGSVIQPGEGKFTYENGEVACLEALADPNYTFVNWSGSYSDIDNPFYTYVRTSGQICANFAPRSGQDPDDSNDTDGPDPDDPIQEGTRIYVDDNAIHDPGPNDATWSDAQEDGSTEHPFDRIQEAIDAAENGCEIVVSPGTYYERIDLKGKSLSLTGRDPLAREYPVIDGGGSGPVVSLVGGDDPNCTLSGFVLTGGRGDLAGALLCIDNNPTLANCLITGNHWTDPNGAALYLTNSTVALVNCTLADNYSDAGGSGLRLADCNATVTNSILWGNGQKEIRLYGDNLLTIEYSNVAAGWIGLGNMTADPLFARHGYWADPNDPNVVLDSCENEAVWVAGDYHLRSQSGRWEPQSQLWILDDVTSPCIDAGDPTEPVGSEPSPHADIINMGAYGGTAEASKSY